MVKLREAHGFEVQLDRICSPSGARKVRGFFKQVGRTAKRTGRRSSSRYQTGYYQSPARIAWSRRVMVKVSIVRMQGKGLGAARQHLKYIDRDTVNPEHDDSILYSAKDKEVDAVDFLATCKNDRHQFRLIVSPEDGHQLCSLTDFTRGLVQQMEHDLDTRLEWVAANHYDTARPHTHIIIRGKRDDGKDLVIPKDYIIHGIRAKSQELATLELGPVSEIERQQRLFAGIKAERLTELDYNIVSLSKANVIDLTTDEARRQSRFALIRERLNTLGTMGLADPMGKGRWHARDGFAATLKRMGERGDIIKTLNRALTENNLNRFVDGQAIYNPATASRQVTGKIIDTGSHGENHNKGYVILDCLDGKDRFVDVGSVTRLKDLQSGFIVTTHPYERAAGPSDITIARLAEQHGGHYSAAHHMEAEPTASIKYLQSHQKRLQALARAGLVTQAANGAWPIPPDFLNKCADHEFARAKHAGPRLTVNSRLGLKQMQKAVGHSWLDEHMRNTPSDPHPHGFGKELGQARQIRRQFLLDQGIIPALDSPITDQHLATLEARDLQKAAKEIADRTGLNFENEYPTGRISGKLIDTITRPSGKYAVLQRAHQFSLVPWDDRLTPYQGRSISGIVRDSGINWQLGRKRGLDIGM